MPSPYNTLNKYFDFYHQTNEQNFYADFIDEELRITGTECLFIPKTYESVDKILGEPYKTLYDRFYPLPCRLTTPEGYGGDRRYDDSIWSPIYEYQ